MEVDIKFYRHAKNNAEAEKGSIYIKDYGDSDFIIGDIKTVYFVMPDTPNDLSVWAAYKDATDKVMAYYARDARYDLKNQDVKEALDNWFSVIKKPSKQTEPLVKAWEEKEKQERDRNLAMSKMTSKSM